MFANSGFLHGIPQTEGVGAFCSSSKRIRVGERYLFKFTFLEETQMSLCS